MDFFAQQDKARRQTRLLVLLFILAVIAIIIAVDIVAILLVARAEPGTLPAAPEYSLLREHSGLLILTSLGTAGFIALASLFRIASLSAGGGKVARSLGGTLITPDTQDPLRRRLHNVVEEMALASGVPVPEVYVLEQESGLNAFAAGFTPGDAAIAVTRGSLETFNRNELQGVIAHEFSHVLNGDMRLNMRLMGILFGILAISVIGRTLLRSMRYARFRSSRSNDRGGGMAVALAIGLALAIIGYVGLFFGRLIKAGISRQREYLADASAVQFTRQTEGLSGALKKIGYGSASVLVDTDGEEISHMLFANGLRSFFTLYATHPPIEQRIKALEPGFDPVTYQREAAQRAAAYEELATEERGNTKTGTGDAKAQLQRLMQSLLILTPGAVSESIGNPSEAHIQHAAGLRQQIPAVIRKAAQSPTGALLLTLGLLLDPDDGIRARQVQQLAGSFGAEHLSLIQQIHAAIHELGPQFRLPLLDLTFPALKQRPHEQVDRLLELVRELIEIDGQVTTFEYLLSRVLMSHLRDAEHPQRATAKRRIKLVNSVAQLHTLFSVLACLGHPDDATAARDAYQVGMLALLPNTLDWPDYQPPESWIEQLDQALEHLDMLPAMLKEELVKSLTNTISHDGKVTLSEAELLRSVCAILHCPLPPFLPDSPPPAQA